MSKGTDIELLEPNDVIDLSLSAHTIFYITNTTSEPSGPAIRGITGGELGRYIIIYNNNANSVLFSTEDAAETTSANRFNFSSDVTLGQNGSITLVYGPNNRWNKIGYTT
jgi:uncharacterized protein (UPF0333 family)